MSLHCTQFCRNVKSHFSTEICLRQINYYVYVIFGCESFFDIVIKKIKNNKEKQTFGLTL